MVNSILKKDLTSMVPSDHEEVRKETTGKEVHTSSNRDGLGAHPQLVCECSMLIYTHTHTQTHNAARIIMYKHINHVQTHSHCIIKYMYIKTG